MIGHADPLDRPEPLDEVVRMFTTDGARDYLGEPVTQAEHMLQAAWLAEQRDAPDALVAAALLHDVGHYQGTITGDDLMAGTDNRHSETGAEWLALWYGPEVTEPVRFHVEAKRYLCSVDASYHDRLSPASRFTLGIQGGPLDEASIERFRALPCASEAVFVRGCDDDAKVPGALVPGLEHFLPLLKRLLRA